jgi:hypothetical protein
LKAGLKKNCLSMAADQAFLETMEAAVQHMADNDQPPLFGGIPLSDSLVGATYGYFITAATGVATTGVAYLQRVVPSQ